MAREPQQLSAVTKIWERFGRKRNLVLAAVAVAALIVVVTGQRQQLAEQKGGTPVHTEKVSEEQVKYQRITQDEAQAKMTADAVILDVRAPEEFDAGHIPNAVLLPDYEIGTKAAGLLPDKDQVILVYCRSGRRSQAAAMALTGMGYTQVYDFGGIIDWQGEIER